MVDQATIQRLTARKGVRAIAVENFLGSLDPADSKSAMFANLRDDARAYKWNAATVAAISDGITAWRPEFGSQPDER